ncbi:MAG: UDP-glucuronic acid decarboxylase family protein [Candidatus Omnitrophota bacterium]|nr:SDR family oxidoreductase [bacterium]MBU3929137.1 SDR family oxidoreductase [bacterium]
MRIVITGGAGFIGSHLCDRFLKEGAEIICMDNLITGSTENIKHLFSNQKFSFMEYDVTNYIYVDGAVDGILHLASCASPVDYLKFPIQTLKVGSIGTHKALGFAKAKKAVFLMASTSEVYGDPLVNPQKEEYWGNVNCVGPRGVYDESKRFAEALTMAYHYSHGVDSRIIRIFNTYGPRMRAHDGRVVPELINQALEGKPLTVFGDGSQTRSFCYIDDMVEGIYRLFKSAENDPVNIGNPDEKKIRDFAETIINITGSSSKIVFGKLPADDPKVRCPDISRAKKILGWSPKVPLKDGLRSAVEYFKSLNLRGGTR